MKVISVTLTVFLFCGRGTNACSSNANKNEGNHSNFFEIAGSIQKAKDEYETPAQFQVQWLNIMAGK